MHVFNYTFHLAYGYVVQCKTEKITQTMRTLLTIGFILMQVTAMKKLNMFKVGNVNREKFHRKSSFMLIIMFSCLVDVCIFTYMYVCMHVCTIIAKCWYCDKLYIYFPHLGLFELNIIGSLCSNQVNTLFPKSIQLISVASSYINMRSTDKQWECYNIIYYKFYCSFLFYNPH